MRSTWLYSLFAILAVVIILIGWASINQVDIQLTEEDREAVSFLLRHMGLSPGHATYDEQLKTIRAVQSGVLAIAPINEGIPLGEAREPKDLLAAGRGLCYDRSRTIEKVLRALGFEVRHVSIYSAAERPAILAMFIPSTPSHAVSEVRTEKGWIVVDSNAPWVSIDKTGNPVSLSTIRRSVSERLAINWETPPPSEIYIKPFVFVCGLYSRHGQFYPPYNRWPDLNYRELFSCIG